MIHVRQLNLLPQLTQSSLLQYFLSFEYNEVPVDWESSSHQECVGAVKVWSLGKPCGWSYKMEDKAFCMILFRFYF